MKRLEVRLRQHMLLLAAIVTLITIVSIVTITQLYIQTLPQEIIEAIDNDSREGGIGKTFQGYRQIQLLAILIAAGLATLATLAFAKFSATKVAHPIQQISEKSVRIAQGDFSARLPQETTNQSLEVATLSQNFNRMAQSLESLEQERKDMIASIAHDLRTPLSAIQIRLELLQEKIIVFDDSELELLLSQTEMLGRLIDDLRTLSLVDAGKLSLNLQVVNLVELIARLLETYRYMSESKQVTLIFEQPEIPIYANVDSQRLNQIVGNLLNNAFRFTPEFGHIQLILTEDTDSVNLDVVDSGQGISESLLPTIFDRFSKGKDTTESSGLGLAIAKSLTELHQGTISASNAVTGGAQFSITLPILN